MKGFIRIGGASFLGILLILGAFIMAKNNGPAPEVVATVVAAPERTTIETKDENGNGIADWKEELGTFETIQTPPPVRGEETPEPYEEPTTFTGKFSIAFVKDYLEAKSRGVDFSDSSAFVGTAVEAVERSTASRTYSRLDFVIVPSSEESLRQYGNELVAILEKHEPPGTIGDELILLRKALDEDRPEILNGLMPIKEAYAAVVIDMLRMPVPTELASAHVELLNLYSSMSANISAMQLAMDDPLLTLARIRSYVQDIESIPHRIRTVSNILTRNGVVYTREEGGSQLYLFDL